MINVTDFDLYDELVVKFKTLTEDELGEIYIQINCLEWPKLISDLKPVDWDRLKDRDKYRTSAGKAVYEAIAAVTTKYQRSKAWWVKKLGRTEAEHDVWWHNQPKVL